MNDAMPAAARLRIRLYRHGLGDCMLLRFAKTDGDSFNLLIDCGVIGVGTAGKAATEAVARDIAAVCGGRLDVLAMTHEHWDHASGFSHLQARDIFEKVAIGEVWYAWTEDPDDALGARLKAERAAKVRTLVAACQALAANGMKAAADRVGGLLEFFGLDGSNVFEAAEGIGRTRAAFEYPMRHAARTRFCRPQDAPLTLPGVAGVRVFVLGPPASERLIKKSAPSRSDSEVYEAGGDAALAASLEAAFMRLKDRKQGGEDGDEADLDGDDAPFPPALRRATPPAGGGDPLSTLVDDLWDDADQDWRRIDDDWTHAAEDLALNLDAHTNNTSLVLAFEFTDTGQVFLFPADAQVGNWLSWQDLRWQVAGREVTAGELLRRTAFYKAGHHGSHNATLRAAGLELMQDGALVAFIPVVKSEAERKGWRHMPFAPLLARLHEKTGGRVLQSDQEPAAGMPGLVTDALYFELSFG